MDKYTITITREFGSLGRPIAHALSQKLGVEYYDRDIVDEVAKQLNLPVSQISDAEETSHPTLSSPTCSRLAQTNSTFRI